MSQSKASNLFYFDDSQALSNTYPFPGDELKKTKKTKLTNCGIPQVLITSSGEGESRDKALTERRNTSAASHQILQVNEQYAGILALCYPNSTLLSS
jgi:hypothetical protein